MKTAIAFMCAALILIAFTGCAGETAALQPADTDVPAGVGAPLELFAVNVGKGDALIVRSGDWSALIDAGKPLAMGRVRSALEWMGITELDAVFLTHADSDHAGGLEWLAGSDIPVGTWYASGVFTEVKEGKHPIVKAASARGTQPVWLMRDDAVALGDSGAVFHVLAPFTVFDDKDDNNSLVMLLEGEQGRMLFTGDMELPQESALMQLGDDLHCDVLKVPNHGDDDTVSAAFAQACQAKLAIISTSTDEKPDTPNAAVLSRLQAAGSACAITQEAALGLYVRLSGGMPELTRVNIDAAPLQVAIAGVEAGEDTVTLTAAADADLTGCYLSSDRGNEIYRFPDGTWMHANESITVGTRTSDEGSYDLLWDEKKVIHKSKSDVITLYDAFGYAVDSMDNGK